MGFCVAICCSLRHRKTETCRNNQYPLRGETRE